MTTQATAGVPEARSGREGDRVLDRALSLLLIGGITLSAAVTGIGGVVSLVQRRGEHASLRTFVPAGPEASTLAGVWRGVLAGHGESIIALGVLLLIATPVARVAFSLVSFAIERDRVYVIITAIVLVLLGYGLLGGTV